MLFGLFFFIVFAVGFLVVCLVFCCGVLFLVL